MEQGSFDGGIFMMSDVSGTCKAYNAKVEPHAIGHLGDVEHLRAHLDAKEDAKGDPLYGPIEFEKNTLYWMTDRTPHESLPVADKTFRRYFRLVTGKVSVWYEKHSTANPLVEPDAEILTEDKFAAAPGS